MHSQSYTFAHTPGVGTLVVVSHEEAAPEAAMVLRVDFPVAVVVGLATSSFERGEWLD
ncbi:hypothetical protein DPMN_044383 [Dreissena polymorpha]|uniref:Uncharacterized protein n=1 Tax=Dreissena polymorpha TaxID=45954 RepID=A0A9D4D2A8_DREPO|nr:hypothetical protein DPMN_044383 [Dreissena polymorpha]